MFASLQTISIDCLKIIIQFIQIPMKQQTYWNRCESNFLFLSLIQLNKTFQFLESRLLGMFELNVQLNDVETSNYFLKKLLSFRSLRLTNSRHQIDLSSAEYIHNFIEDGDVRSIWPSNAKMIYLKHSRLQSHNYVEHLSFYPTFNQKIIPDTLELRALISLEIIQHAWRSFDLDFLKSKCFHNLRNLKLDVHARFPCNFTLFNVEYLNVRYLQHESQLRCFPNLKHLKVYYLYTFISLIEIGCLETLDLRTLYCDVVPLQLIKIQHLILRFRCPQISFVQFQEMKNLQTLKLCFQPTVEELEILRNVSSLKIVTMVTDNLKDIYLSSFKFKIQPHLKSK